MLSTIIDFLKSEPKFVVSVGFGLVSIVVNIIIAIKNHDACKLKEALLSISEVISMVEEISKEKPLTSIEKKSMAEAILHNRFGKIYLKHSKLFDDAIEDILNTPQKKGGSVDVSQKG